MGVSVGGHIEGLWYRCIFLEQERGVSMPTPLEIETSIRANDTLGVFNGVGGLNKLRGISVGVSRWLGVGYEVDSFSVGSGGVGVCQGVLKLGGDSVLLEGALRGVGMSGLLVGGYSRAVGGGLVSLVYGVVGSSGGVGSGAFTIVGGRGLPSQLYSDLVSSVGESGSFSSLELEGLSRGIVALFTVGVSGGGAVVGSASPSALTAPNPPLRVV